MLGHKEVTNCEEILSEFGVVVVGSGCVRITRNHVEGGAVSLDGAFKELDAKTSESIPVGDHNIDDAVAFDELQKGKQTFALEVEA